MIVGLLFGSFNPIHTGHLIIANHIANYYCDEVWFVVSPQNPHKNVADLLPAINRINLVRVAIEDDNRFKVSDIEFELPKPSYTIDTLRELQRRFDTIEFQIIMGSDNLVSFPEWKLYKEIIFNFKILVYERPYYPINNYEPGSNITIAKGPLLDISATTIRKSVSENKSVKYLLPEKVIQLINKNNFYKK